MSTKVIQQILFTDAQGQRQHTPADFPLKIASKVHAGATAALLSIHDNRVYIEAQDAGIEVRVNHHRVEGPTALHPGDTLQIEAAHFQIAHAGNTFSISVVGGPSGQDSDTHPVVPHGEVISPLVPPKTAARKPGWRLRGAIPLAGAAVLITLVLLVVHVFTAKSLKIEIDPAADSVRLQGTPWPLKIRGRYLVRPGEYRLQATRDGYHPLDQEIRVGTGASQTLAFTLLKHSGYLNITSVPEHGVHLLIDDKPFGVTPVERIELPAGTYTLQALAERYLPYTTQLVMQGELVQQDLRIQLQPGWSEVSIDSRPELAEVWLNGVRKGKTPVRLELMAGEYRLDLRHPDYLTHTSDFRVLADQPLALAPVHLQTGTSHVLIDSTPSGAHVFIEGIQKGTTPLTIALAPNAQHRLTLTKPGYRPSRQSLRIRPGEQQTVNARLEAILGTVIVHPVPEDAEVLVQGQSAGHGRLRLSLPSAPHRLEVRKSGYQNHAQTVTPKPQAPQVIEVSLKPSADHGPRTGPARIHTHLGETLVRLEGGEFSMGAPRREQGRRTNETLHTVSLQRPFYLATTEVTNARFAAFMASHHSGSYRGYDLSAPELPVVNITWADAVRYCNWLSEQEGLDVVYEERNGTWVAKNPIPSGYRLPTESEWEWAARWQANGTLAKYAWGENYPPVEITGNYADRTAAGILELTLDEYDDGYAVAAPVGSFRANPLGLFDMDGNVAEWSHDYHSLYPALSDAVYVDPAGPATGTKHVVRGASWKRSDLSNTRLSYRDQDNKRHVDLGFRIARYLD
ncbi:MAG: SUMF1/EgtB/PvdO family nonheme iron enzyme [Gammaproteobacteria bacterium]|nr:SUMF1/EgtB/PvdO family nonheme iron enzyme [Gammaproteobacteria bacterium]